MPRRNHHSYNGTDKLFKSCGILPWLLAFSQEESVKVWSPYNLIGDVFKGLNLSEYTGPHITYVDILMDECFGDVYDVMDILKKFETRNDILKEDDKMFEYLLDPREGCSIQDISFTFDEIERIEDITNNVMSDDYEFQEFLEKYEDPFWAVYYSIASKKLKLEIHAVVDDSDAEWIKEKFAERVKRALELMFEEAFMKQRKGGNRK